MVSRLKYEIYACLKVAGKCQQEIARFLANSCGVSHGSIQNNMHLTVYHAVIPLAPLKGLAPKIQPIAIKANADETRFMVFTMGGEVAIPGVDPAHHSVGIRLTKRNRAIEEIQFLRRSIYQLEENSVLGTRGRTSAWKNNFGPTRYQPHIKLLFPGSFINSDLTIAGESFRSQFEDIKFDEFVVEIR